MMTAYLEVTNALSLDCLRLNKGIYLNFFNYFSWQLDIIPKFLETEDSGQIKSLISR
jgi:hypothetical protein